MEYQWKTDGEERWRTDVIEAEIEKIDAMSRSQLLEYSSQIIKFSWFISMIHNWQKSFPHSPGDSLRDIDLIHCSLHSRLKGKLFSQITK